LHSQNVDLLSLGSDGDRVSRGEVDVLDGDAERKKKKRKE